MTAGAEPPPAVERWHRLHPLSPVVRAGRHLIALLLLAVPALDNGRHGNRTVSLIAEGGFLVIVLLLGVVSWLVTRWRVEQGALRIETGLVRRSSQRFPLAQVQAIDIERTGTARLFGLAELRLRMAGSQHHAGRLAALPDRDVEALRAQLLAIGHGSTRGAPGGGTATDGTGPDRIGFGAGADGAGSGGSGLHGVRPGVAPTDSARGDVAGSGGAGQDAALSAPPADGQPPEWPLFSLPTPRLLASMSLTKSGLAAGAVVISIVVLSAVSPATAAAVVAGGAASFVGLFTTVWRRFNGGYRLTVAEAPDGLRLRSGLVQTTAETIPYGRIQAVRLVEPLLWRPLGWCRLDVDLAGGRARQENRSEGRHSRTILPVGDRDQADRLLRRVIQDPDASLAPPPVRTRWKAPLSYHFLGWGDNGRCVVTTGGRVRRVTHWVPLEKVQSIRRGQGPLQRRLGLASIHLDTAGRRSKATLRDRDVDEVDREVERLPALCRAARQACGLPASTPERRLADDGRGAGVAHQAPVPSAPPGGAGR